VNEYRVILARGLRAGACAQVPSSATSARRFSGEAAATGAELVGSRIIVYDERRLRAGAPPSGRVPAADRLTAPRSGELTVRFDAQLTGLMRAVGSTRR
jgi:hypothetical protein